MNTAGLFTSNMWATSSSNDNNDDKIPNLIDSGGRYVMVEKKMSIVSLEKEWGIGEQEYSGWPYDLDRLFKIAQNFSTIKLRRMLTLINNSKRIDIKKRDFASAADMRTLERIVTKVLYFRR